MPRGIFTNPQERSRKISEKLKGRKTIVTWGHKIGQANKGKLKKKTIINGGYKNKNSLHAMLSTWYVKEEKCEFCGQTSNLNDKQSNFDWANVTGVYSVLRENWKVLCSKCHNKFDKHIVVILSGGMDSVTLLYWLKSQKYHIEALTFDYGQRHKKEIEFAKATCKKLNISHSIVNTSSLNEFIQGSSLTTESIAVPHGHYEDENMKKTVVPNRNAIMLSIAVGFAVSKGINKVYTAVHAGDHTIYPDCRPEFIKAINEYTQIANYVPVRVEAPFLNIDKGDIAKIGRILKVDYSLAWTCYEGKELPCGLCGACQERAEAMAKAGLIDPLIK